LFATRLGKLVAVETTVLKPPVHELVSKFREDAIDPAGKDDIGKPE
jgi:hypothetical protein